MSNPNKICMLVAALVVACGTRAGNPKKPDGDTPKAVVSIPRFDVDFAATPAATASGANLTAQGDGLAEDLAEGPRRARFIVDALNTLVDSLNGAEIPVDEVFTKSFPNGELTAKVTKAAAESGYDYIGVFCAGGRVFYETRWNEVGTKIVAVRDFELNPFTAEDPALQAGTEMKAEVALDSSFGTTKIDSRQHGKPRRQSYVYPELDMATDLVRVESTEGGYLYRSAVALHASKDQKTADFTPQIHVAGKFASDGTEKMVAHHAGTPVLCPGAFDETNAAAPGWCFGLERSATQDIPKFLAPTDRDAFWAEIGSIGIVNASDLRAVTFSESCPVEK